MPYVFTEKTPLRVMRSSTGKVEDEFRIESKYVGENCFECPFTRQTYKRCEAKDQPGCFDRFLDGLFAERPRSG
jgi:hypothetical protein